MHGARRHHHRGKQKNQGGFPRSIQLLQTAEEEQLQDRHRTSGRKSPKGKMVQTIAFELFVSLAHEIDQYAGGVTGIKHVDGNVQAGNAAHLAA